MQDINVEEIMREIREDIERKGYTSDMLSFQEVAVSDKAGYSYDYEELERLAYQVNNNCNVVWRRELSGNSLEIFIKKVIRKTVAFLFRPVWDEQNAFNGSTTRVINQLMGYIDAQNDKVQKLEKNIEALEERVAQLTENSIGE